ncbi:MAG: P-loop NTPase [Pirellulales bacterium]
MPDQAAELRKLMLAAPHESLAGAGSPPRLVVLSGAANGVGTSTLAVNLAVALADQGARVVLVDADARRADIATLCGIAEQQKSAEEQGVRRDIHEVLMRGPAGIQVAPGAWAPNARPGSAWGPNAAQGLSEKSQYRLLRQLKSLGRHAEWVLLDAGCGAPDVVRRFWQAADDVLMVTTPEPNAVLEAYAAFKTLLVDSVRPRLRLVVNQAADGAAAQDVHQRIDQSCRRFLGREVRLAGHLPVDALVADAARRQRPVLMAHANSNAAQAVVQLASRLLAENPDASGREERGVA